MSIVFLNKEQGWECPNCDSTRVTQDWPHPVGPMHNCTRLAGMAAPHVMAGVRARVEAHEREDFINGELVRRNSEGRPIMNVTTTFDDHEDVVVFAPSAYGVGSV